MATIQHIRIKRFKRLSAVDIELDDATLLIGANNAGKSSSLQAIQFAVSLAQSARLIGGVSWAADKYELSFSQTQLLYCPISEAMAIAFGGQLVEDAAQRVEVEFELTDGVRSTVSLRKGRNRNLKVAIEGQQLGTQLQDLENPFSIYAPGLAGVARTETYMSKGALLRTVARGDANLSLRNVLLQLSREQAQWDIFIADMRHVFPGIEIVIQFDEDRDEYVSVGFRHENGPQIPLDAAGTSVLQASQILSYISLFRPKLLLLDEPDSHLHPDRQRVLCRLVCDLASDREFRVIMSSHSRHVFDALRETAQVVWLARGSIVEEDNANTTRCLLDLGALDSIDYFADGQLKCVVATEDADTSYISTLLEASGFPDEELEIVSYPGCSQTEAAIVLGSFLTEKAPNTRLIVHSDRDYRADQEVQAFKERLQAKNIIPFVTNHSDIEGYFVNATHLAATNALLSEQRAGELIDQATADTRDQSVKAIVNLRMEHAYRARNRGGPNPNAGNIAVAAANEYDADPALMRRGKPMLGQLKALIQAETGHNAVVTSVTQHVDIPELRAIKNEVWNNNQ